jgi:hypothetical protein
VTANRVWLSLAAAPDRVLPHGGLPVALVPAAPRSGQSGLGTRSARLTTGAKRRAGKSLPKCVVMTCRRDHARTLTYPCFPAGRCTARVAVVSAGLRVPPHQPITVACVVMAVVPEPERPRRRLRSYQSRFRRPPCYPVRRVADLRRSAQA